MKSYVQYVKDKLMESIQTLGTLKNMYIEREGKDFTRNRKLSFETVVKLILEMEGKTLGHELRRHFSFSLDMPSVSAFVQRRSLISLDAFLYLFHTFNFALPSEKRFEGYRLVACNGSDLNIARNPKDKDNFFQSNPGEKDSISCISMQCMICAASDIWTRCFSRDARKTRHVLPARWSNAFLIRKKRSSLRIAAMKATMFLLTLKGKV